MSRYVGILCLFYYRHKIGLCIGKGIAIAAKTIVSYHFITRNGVVPIIRFLYQCLYLHSFTVKMIKVSESISTPNEKARGTKSPLAA